MSPSPTQRIFKILCPACGVRGTVVWESSPLRSRRAAHLTAGFVSVDRGHEGDPHCECGRCRVPTVDDEAEA